MMRGSLLCGALIPPDAAILASLRINNLHVFCAHSEHSTVIMLSDC